MPPGLPKPGTLRFEVLEALVRNDEASVPELRKWLRPGRRYRTPVTGGADFRRRTQARETEARVAAREIRRELTALQRRGLVETVGPAALEDWSANLVEKHGLEEGVARLLRYAYPAGFIDHDPHAEGADGEGELSPTPPARLPATILVLLADGPKKRGEVSTEALDGKRENGAFQRAWEVFVEAGVIRPSSQRRPTQAGRDLIAEHKEGAACA